MSLYVMVVCEACGRQRQMGGLTAGAIELEHDCENDGPVRITGAAVEDDAARNGRLL